MPRIKLEHGITVTTFEQPPSGFDPLTTNKALLEKHGFPLHVDYPELKERYERVMSQLKGKMTYIQPTFRVNAEKGHGPNKRVTTPVPARRRALEARGSIAAGTETSANWSGGVVYAPGGQSFRWIMGDWVVPNGSAPTQGQWYYGASWIGIDGDGSGDVCQAGVECECFQLAWINAKSVYPWWEWYPLREVQITNFPVSPGDYVTMVLCTNQAAGSSTATVFFANRTSGASTSFPFNAPDRTSLMGNSAEWVVEAPTVGGAQSSIADYGEVFFNACEAVTNTGTIVKARTVNDINMTAGGSVVSDGVLVGPHGRAVSVHGHHPIALESATVATCVLRDLPSAAGN
jgi:hypothetical protein